MNLRKRFISVCFLFPLICNHAGPMVNSFHKHKPHIVKTKKTIKHKKTDRELFIDAIIWCESRKDSLAVNHSSDAKGILQITPIYVKEVNRILEIQGSEKRYHLRDRKSNILSKEMFAIYQAYHNPDFNKRKCLKQHRGINSHGYNKAVFDKYKELRTEYNQLRLACR